MDILLKGLITGLFLSFFIGATFFMLIETIMTRGFRAALWFDLGVLISDAAIIAVIYFFTSWITRTIVQNSYFNIAGGLIFVGFGINYILSRHRNDSLMVAKSRNIRLFMNGFFINLMNPSVVIFWLSAMAIALSKFGLTGRETILYFGSALSVVAVTDIFKAYFAYKLSGLLNSRLLKRVYMISGLLMIGLGVYIIFN